MNDKTPETDNLIHFPQMLRVVPIEPAEAHLSVPLDQALALIEHDGRLYDLAPLVQQMSFQKLTVLDAAAPRSGQELWDEVVRRWPALAAEIVAGARPVG